jgi:hypothetical protein
MTDKARDAKRVDSRRIEQGAVDINCDEGKDGGEERMEAPCAKD